MVDIIINSVDRSLYMYLYDLYIYIYISLSIYRSISLYLFWLADIFASVERPDNKSLQTLLAVNLDIYVKVSLFSHLHTSCIYDTYKAFKFIV